MREIINETLLVRVYLQMMSLAGFHPPGVHLTAGFRGGRLFPSSSPANAIGFYFTGSCVIVFFCIRQARCTLTYK